MEGSDYKIVVDHVVTAIGQGLDMVPINAATDNKLISKEPESRLIDKRFDNVKDWNKIEKDSSKERINKNTCNRCKNK